MPQTNRKRILRDEIFKNSDNKNTDFTKAFICNVDFTGVDLTGAIFTDAKIKGADFTKADLTGAIFDNAVFGVKTSWKIFILIISLILMSLSGFSASIVISCIYYFYSPLDRINKKPSINILIIFISTVYITLLHTTIIHALTPIDSPLNKGALVSYFIYIAIFIIIIIGVFVPFIKVMDEYESKDKHIFFTIIIFSILLIFINLYLSTQLVMLNEIIRRAIGAFSGSLLGTTITALSILKNKNYAWIFELFVHIVSLHGNKFYCSTLNDASFINTNIKGSTFVKCETIRTNWDNIKKIDCSRFKVHYLDNPEIRYLLIQKRIAKHDNNKWKNMDLRGLNLSDAILNKVDFSGADFRGSTLNGAELKESNLSNTLLDNVDLSGGVDITGAIIGIKSIPPTAKVEGLICEYFRSESNSNQRYPIDGVLTNKEAIKLLQKSSEITLTSEGDFEGDINWEAFLQSFKICLNQVGISDDEHKKFIQAFETESDGDFGIRLNVPNKQDKQAFRAKLLVEYKKLKRQHPKIHQNNQDILGITETLASTNIIINTINNETKSMSESYQSKDHQRNSHIQSGDTIDINKSNIANVKGYGKIDKAIVHEHNSPEQQHALHEVVAEIKEIIQRLEQSNSTETATSQMVFAAQVTEVIDNNPTLKQRVIGVFKGLGTEAFKEAVDHPIVNILVAGIQGGIDP